MRLQKQGNTITTPQAQPLIPPGSDLPATPFSKNADTKEPQEPSAPSTAQQISKVSPAVATAESEANESLPVTGSKATQHKDRSIELWNEAYDKLEADEGTTKLANAYRETLAKLLTDQELRRRKEARNVTDPSAANAKDDPAVRKAINAKILDELKVRDNRPKYMGEFVKEGQEKVAKASKRTVRVGAIANLILKAKPVADIVLQIPQAAPAALPWAGVCIGLEVSLRDLTCRCSTSQYTLDPRESCKGQKVQS